MSVLPGSAATAAGAISTGAIGGANTAGSHRGGMVTSPHHLATEAGRQVLADGGNAIEAAIATGAVLTVVYPHMNSIGGDAFFSIADQHGRAFGLDGAGAAGAAYTIDAYARRGLSAIPKRGPLAANTVAGMVAVWGKAFEHSRREWGGRSSWARLLAPAISLARDGFELNAGQPSALRDHWKELSQSKAFCDIFAPAGAADGEPRVMAGNNSSPRFPVPGELFKQAGLANSLGLLAEEGADTFYRGELAARIVAGLKADGCLFELEDLASFECRQVELLTVPYGVGQVANLPPPSVGLAALLILGILDRLPIKGLDHLSADFIHLHAEAAKLAHAVRDRYLGDPDHTAIPLRELLSPAYLDQLARRIDPNRAAAFSQPIDPGDTVWFGVVDAEHRGVSAIQSLCWEYGAGVMAGDTGIVWHNRGHGFSLEPGRPNSLAPGKRPSHTLNAPLYFENGRLRIVYGTMGGEAQPQISGAVLTRVLDLDVSPADAVAAPRWVLGRAWGDQSVTSLKLEHRFEQRVFDGLRAKGHDVEWFAEYSDYMGHAGLIRIADDGSMSAACDPRSDGAVGGVAG